MVKGKIIWPLFIKEKNKIGWFSGHLSGIYEILKMIDASYMFTLDRNETLMVLFIIQPNQNFSAFVFNVSS